MVRVVMRFPLSALIHNKNNIINIFGTVEFQLTPLFVRIITLIHNKNIRYPFEINAITSTKGIQTTVKYQLTPLLKLQLTPPLKLQKYLIQIGTS